MTEGDRISAIRKGKKITQKVLSERTGIAEPTIRRYESNRLNPKFETLQKIAAALEVPVTDLKDVEQYKADMENLEKTITDYINESGDWVKRAKTNEGIITLPPDFEEFERYIGKSGFKIELDNKGQYWLETKDKRIALSVADLMGLVRSSRATVSALAQSLLDQPAEN